MYHLEVPALHQQLAMVFFIREEEISTVCMVAIIE